MSKYLAFLAGLPVLLLSLTVTAVAAVEKQLPVLAIEYPPYLMAAADDHGSSFSLLEKRLAGSGWQVEAVFLPAARAVVQMAAADRHWLLSFMPPAAGEADVQRIVLSDDGLKSGLFRRRQPAAFRWQTLQDLAGHSVVSIRTNRGSELAAAMEQAGLRLMVVNNIEQGISLLLSGRVDYLQALEATGYYYARQLDIDEQQLQFSETLLSRYPVAVYVNTRDARAAELIKDLQRPPNGR